MKHRKCKAVDEAFGGIRTIVDGCYMALRESRFGRKKTSKGYPVK